MLLQCLHVVVLAQNWQRRRVASGRWGFTGRCWTAPPPPTGAAGQSGWEVRMGVTAVRSGSRAPRARPASMAPVTVDPGLPVPPIPTAFLPPDEFTGPGHACDEAKACRAETKGGNCSLFKWAVTAFCLCIAQPTQACLVCFTRDSPYDPFPGYSHSRQPITSDRPPPWQRLPHPDITRPSCDASIREWSMWPLPWNYTSIQHHQPTWC